MRLILWKVKIGEAGGDGDILKLMVLSSVVHDRHRPIAVDQFRLSSCRMVGRLKAERMFLIISSRFGARFR